MDVRRIRHPERIVPLAFMAGIGFGTLLLMLPIARAGGLIYHESAPFMVALFTATSAFCVTGLTVVETAAYWSAFGHVVLIVLAQIGGLGIMTGATLLGLLVSRRLPLRGKLMASEELRSLDLGDVTNVLRLVLVTVLTTELVVAVLLWLRLWLGNDIPVMTAAWFGLFHGVSAVMNLGFTILPEGLAPHRADWLLALPLMLGVIVGGFGFPVLYELQKEWRTPARWSIHTKLTLWGSIGLIVAGALLVLGGEWNNPATLGGAGWPERLLGALFHSVMTRSAGFSLHDTEAMHATTILGSIALMMIGGGSASTAGGIRVTTFLLLGYVVWSEVRGWPDTVAFGRRIGRESQRQAVTVTLLAIGIVAIGLFVLAAVSPLPADRLLFEAVSAFATVGLSVGVSPELPPAGQMVLVVLMYIGRVGIVSIAAAVALRQKSIPWRYPEERVIVG